MSNISATAGNDIGQTSRGNDLTVKDSEKSSSSSYRQIFKATSLFGGVQVIKILVGIVRVKFVAVLLGTAGVGIIGLLNSPIELIISVTSLGIAFSAVRDISEANSSNDKGRLAKVVVTLRRWSVFTGVLGAIVTIALAPLLSQWSFGNKDYTWAFIWLSITLLLLAISKAQKAILQGTRRLKHLAKASILGSVLGLITSLPLYYWFGTDGIVPAMILTAVTTLFLSWYFVRKVRIDPVRLSNKQAFFSGLNIARLGIYMTAAGFIAAMSRYILNAFISNLNGVDQVGLYNAGWGVVGQYTSIVFTAMATDYFPRLSAVQSDNTKVRELVSQQSETALLIITPLLTLLIVTMPIVIRVLYTAEFLPVVMFACLTVLGMQFKAVSWAMGYVYLAKGNGRLFLIMEIITGVVILALNLLFYSAYGLNGLGASFVISFLIGSAFSFLVLRKKYQFSFPRKFFLLLLTTYGIVAISFSTIFLENQILRYSFGILTLLGAGFYSYTRLNEMMDIRSLIRDRFRRK